MMASFAPALLLVVMMLMASSLSSCGRKTGLQVPDSPRPETIRNITVTTRDTVAFLSWAIPSVNAEGRPLAAGDILKFRIYRAETGKEKRKARHRLYHEIDLKDPSPAVIRGNTVIWSDADMEYGQSYSYQIRTVSVRGGVSAWSDEVWAVPILSLAIPQGLTAQAGDGSIVVSWGSVTAKRDLSPHEGFIGYNLYRSTEPGKYDPAPLNKEPLTRVSYRDTSVVNDSTYYYIVRSVDKPSSPWNESLDSSEVSATPKDMTPPSRPSGLTVVPGVGRVFLTWNENSERDLGGYYLYRSADGGKTFIRLVRGPVTRTTYSDETVQQGAMYLYRITAVDQSGNESESSDHKQAYVEKMLNPR